MKFICSRCGKEESAATRKPHCSCGGLWDLAWRPPRFSLSQVDCNRWSLFRYREFIALEDESWQAVTLGEGMTPVVPLDGDTLLKMEYFMPTLSFKDRDAAALITYLSTSFS